jgi:hypothetical protein
MSEPVPAMTCLLCLNLDELPSMIMVEIGHDAIQLRREIVLCRRCAHEIARAVERDGEAPPIDTEKV